MAEKQLKGEAINRIVIRSLEYGVLQDIDGNKQGSFIVNYLPIADFVARNQGIEPSIPKPIVIGSDHAIVMAMQILQTMKAAGDEEWDTHSEGLDELRKLLNE